MTGNAVTGGCQCGAIRYRLTAPPHEVVHCHCSVCRRAHGALFASAAVYDKSTVVLESDDESLARYESSPGNHRMFCSRCGGQLFLDAGHWKDTMFVVLGPLDTGCSPGHGKGNEKHIFWDSGITWYDPSDDLPKHERYGS